MDLQTQLEELQKHQQGLQQEENPGNDKVRGTGRVLDHVDLVDQSESLTFGRF